MLKILSWSIIVFLVIWLIDHSHATELPKEMSMKTDVGEVVLTLEECIFKKIGLQGYDYAAYATEKGHANHEGCWKKEEVNNMSAVLIYFPEINSTAVYNPELFKPRALL